MKHHEFPTIALTGGGSGGHITPLLSLARELKKQRPNCQIVYIGFKGDQFDSLRAGQHDFDFMSFINAGKFRRYHGQSALSHLLDFKTIALNIRDFFRVIKSIGTAYRILSRTEPDVLFAKGGFVSVPVGFAARLKRIPIISHDSDTVGGLANRIVGRWATLHATGMPAKYYHYKKESVRYVGIPLDEHIVDVTASLQNSYKEELGISPESHVLLLAGGGNGSKRLNEMMVQASSKLLSEDITLHILHICGANNFDETKELYKLALSSIDLKRVHLTAFTSDFYKYSGAADLIVSRAGATAIAEFAMQSKACIIIPSPFLTGGHQLKNAELLRENNAALIVDENSSGQDLADEIKRILKDEGLRKTYAKNLHKLSKSGAATELAKAVLDLADEHHG